MVSLAEIPIEVLVDNIVPLMQVSDILHLGCTNKFFAMICSDDTLWRRRLESDYNFSGDGTARTTGWQFIYRGLFRPSVYVWGERSNGRLGLAQFPKVTIRSGIPFPTRLRIPGVRIVSLVAGGMSFHALDSKGRIYVWGALNGTGFLRSDGFSEPGKSTGTPLRLEMPVATRSISCGRFHASSLDALNQIWTFTSWGRPFKLSSNVFVDADSKPVQVECGWGFSSVLTKSGDVYVWWPFSGHLEDIIRQKNDELNFQGDKKAIASPDGVIPCVTWSFDEDPLRLPSIPVLPSLEEQDEEKTPTQLVKIAGLDGHLIGLTNGGHVLVYRSLETASAAQQGRWQYLPEFSELERVRSTFARLDLDPPESMKITHISANFMHFIAYSTGSSSIVLMGDTDSTPESEPKIIPSLQNQSVISVVLGDYHNVALTSTGKTLTWGAYSEGALGLGDPTTLPLGSPGAFAAKEQRERALQTRRGEPPAVETPTEVRFDYGRKTPKDRFCFAIAAAGWHTGALVIDLEPDTSEEKEELPFEPEDPPLPRDFRRQNRLPTHSPGETPPISPGAGIFRVGFPGRGSGFGR